MARVNAGTYVALTRESGEWFGVLMADHSTGWIRKSDINLLDYEVVGPSSPQHPALPDFAAASAQVAQGGAAAVLNAAYRFLGVPYKYGGGSTGGIDCSAFVQRCFQVLGISLPRTAHEQYQLGTPVPPEQLQAADRLYFASRGGQIIHTGIYISNGWFIHASSSRHGVAISRLTEPMYSRMFAGARR